MNINMEQSMISKSTTSESTVTIGNNAATGVLFSDSLDPLFDAMTQYTRVPKPIYYFFMIFIFIQFEYTSLWVEHTTLWSSSEIAQQFIKYLTYFANFSPMLDNEINIFIPFVIFLVLFLIIFCVLIAQIVAFKRQRRFNKTTLYPTRMILELLPLVLMHPCGVYAAKLFKMMVINKNYAIGLILFFVIMLIEFILVTIFAFYATSIIGSSAYLASSPFTTFNSKPFVRIIIISPLFALLTYAFAYFPYWTENVLMVLHILVMILFAFEMSQGPFVTNATNIIFMTIAVSTIVNDIMRFICTFLKNPNSISTTFLSLTFMVLSAIFSVIYFNVRQKKMKKILTILGPEGQENETYRPNDNERNELFQKLKLDKSEFKALSYLDFTVYHNMTQYCIDFYLLKYIIQIHHSMNTLIHCTRIIACIPSSSRNLNILFNEVAKRRDISFTDKFFLFQIQKIKLLRQSSSSVAAGERLKDLKQKTKELESTIRYFWEANNTDTGLLLSISGELSKCQALWAESLGDFPNSIPYNEECSNFMVECASDFIGGIRIRHRIDLIESGKNFNVDICYRQFVRNFPNYLKLKILDLKGNFISLSKNKKGTQNSNSTNGNMVSTSSGSLSELDVAVEEGIGKSIISYAKIRLALQRAVENRKANKHVTLVTINIIFFLLGLFFSLFIFFYFNSYFQNRIESTDRMELMNKARMYLFTTTLMLLYGWGNLTDSIDIFSWDNKVSQYDSPDDISFIPKNDLQTNTIYFNIEGEEQYTAFLEDISTQSTKGINMYEFTNVLFEETTTMVFANATGIIFDPMYYNLKTVLMYLFLDTRLLSGTDNINEIKTWFYDSMSFGTVICTLQEISPSFDDLKITLSKMSTQEAEKSEKLLYILKYVIPIPYIVFCVFTFVIITIIYKNEITFFAKLLLQLPPDVKTQASKPLRKTTEEDTEEFQNNETIIASSAKPIMLMMLVSLLFIAGGVLMVFQIININDYNTQFQYLDSWTNDARIRKSYIVQLTTWITELIIARNPSVNGTYFIDEDKLLGLIETDYDSLNTVTKELITDLPNYPSSTGIDETIDTLTLQKSCTSLDNQSSFHEFYRCGSAQSMIAFFLNTIDECVNKLDEYNGEIKDEISAQLSHMVFTHLLPKLIKIDDRWREIAFIFNDNFSVIHVIFFVFEIVSALIAMGLTFWLIDLLKVSYSIVILLLRRVSPISIVSDNDLLNYLLDKTSNQSNTEMSTDQGIIYNSSDSVLIIGNNGVVDIINPAVSKAFGFTPEQLLGQPISTMFDTDEKAQIEQQLELMKNKQSAPTYEDHTTCISDDDSKIPCSITVLAINGDDGEIKSFVMILRDESDLIHQQQEAEQAKKQSESLLYQILPRDIVVRLNQGEKDISFIVPSSTICFIDIVKFSDYAASLTPQEIMGNLSLIFAEFDESISKYDLLIKIKLIGDVYMCAGGLFTPDEPPSSHAEQMLHFALDAVQILEETNVKLNAVLNVRIGVNTGGPLIAGVLGTDRPTFDIIGDPINVASRLQSTDVPGRVQISQGTYDLVHNMDFSIEPRGEIFLKGKGNQPAYLVSPSKNFTLNLSSNDGTSTTSHDKDSLVFSQGP
ncbi:Adenylate and Guanylate cyclase catalytic domain containing protein [Tritrichomonas foetus]|uniref:Adenylate and Guanylate cyclase catalytic domain containing protein n=1 Tax=Tritrichomonas foetus TaxID=1144522 RepID=A0A1J4KZA9_9EUKA|nr:Adenylate and Guanylate cyclase catalytic domain containing protein [Tritrichomonas foetus]|eukprot:OHT16587.1 Adenylate and Guanylate cyclase catalytic domain containing protein [Tritrichomonas foetus]